MIFKYLISASPPVNLPVRSVQQLTPGPSKTQHTLNLLVKKQIHVSKRYFYHFSRNVFQWRNRTILQIRHWRKFSAKYLKKWVNICREIKGGSIFALYSDGCYCIPLCCELITGNILLIPSETLVFPPTLIIFLCSPKWGILRLRLKEISVMFISIKRL